MQKESPKEKEEQEAKDRAAFEDKVKREAAEAIEKETSKWDINHHKIQLILKLINK